MEVTGKVIVVTGAASGIGRGLCLRFSREGAKAIVAADVNEAGARAVADEIKGEAVSCDVSKEEDMIRLVKFAEDRYGRIDIF
ncbi:MAG TPA: SDR family NAD(P)-dependent oxidoreductase, partial [Smithellaceae bacterium]|nr:SDR family NAD(P)-dependent oxidoreductase [Smithellaceae bacterium]